MGDITFIRYFGVCTNIALSASSQSENSQYLKIKLTRTPFENLDLLKRVLLRLPVFHISTMLMLETKC